MLRSFWGIFFLFSGTLMAEVPTKTLWDNLQTSRTQEDAFIVQVLNEVDRQSSYERIRQIILQIRNSQQEQQQIIQQIRQQSHQRNGIVSAKTSDKTMVVPRHSDRLFVSQSSTNKLADLVKQPEQDASPAVGVSSDIVHRMMNNVKDLETDLQTLANENRILVAENENLHRTSDQSISQESEVQVESEPNNIALQANKIRIGTTVSGEVKNDGDWFYFTARSKCRDLVEISIKNESSTLAPYLEVFDHNKKSLAYREGCDTVGGDYSYRFMANPSNVYYFNIWGHNQTEGKYQVTVKPLLAYDSYEPNDSFMKAQNFPTNGMAHGNILDSSDRDFYRLATGNIPDRYEIELHNKDMTLSPRIVVYDQLKNQIWEDSQTTRGGNLKVNLALRSQTNYYIEVSGSSERPASYDLNIRALSRYDNKEPNNSVSDSKTIEIGKGFHANFTDTNDVDVYKVFIPSNTKRDLYRWTFFPKQRLNNFHLRVLDVDRKSIYERSFVQTDSVVTGEMALDPNKYYFISLSQKNVHQDKVDYYFQLTPRKLYDTSEPNDSFSQSSLIVSTGTITGHIMDASDEDTFHFQTLSERTIVEIKLENLSDTLRPKVLVFNHLKAKVHEYHEATAGGGLEKFFSTNQKNKKFYIKVLSSEGSQGSYKITVTCRAVPKLESKRW